MKTFLTAAALALAAPAFAGPGNPPTLNGRDTILVKLKKSDKLMIITRPGQQGLRGLQEYDINQIISKVDSTLRATQSMAVTEGRDTTLTVQRIPTRLTGDEKKTISISIDRKDGNGRPTLTIRETYSDADNVHIGGSNGFDSNNGSKRKRKRFHRGNDLYVNLGLDNYIDPHTNKTPDGAGNHLALRPTGSRYVAIGYNWAHQFGNSPFGLNGALEIAWHNFMLQDSYRFVKTDSGTIVAPLNDMNVIKSKLTESMVKLPVTLSVSLTRNWALEAGGFVGYRLGSHTKIKYEQNGSEQKAHEYDNFYLSNFQYGVKAQIRYKGLGLFAEYHFNPLFNASGPDLRAFHFGIRI